MTLTKMYNDFNACSKQCAVSACRPRENRVQMVVNLLHIQLLGDFRLINGDELVTVINSPRMQSLLAYLLLHRGAPQPRYHIAFLLWPDSPEGQARSNLRNLLHRLRHAFPAIEDFLIEDNRDLCWRADAPFTFDVADFESELARAKKAEAAGDQDTLQEALEQVTSRYAGDLLPSCYDEWMLMDREHLRQAFLEALEKLSILQENQGQYRQAIASAQRLLRYDPLQEAIYRQLMQLYMLNGDRTGALRVYHTCSTVLKDELDIAPDEATRAIYETLLVGEAQPAPQDSQARRKIKQNLPNPLTSFIGREDEMKAVRQLLSTSRLLTLTGPFGSGKTRLALEIANQITAEEEQFPDGVWWIELAAITDPELAPQAVAAVLGIREKPDEELTETLIDALRERAMLLLLDNCEHFVAACNGLAASLLRACPGLRILATSREALGIKGEVAWAVPPLAYPRPGEGTGKKEVVFSLVSTRADRSIDAAEAARLVQYEAVELFIERAAAALPTFKLTSKNAPAVMQICRRLEGIPLAIELAAARVKMMTVEQIAARLDDALHLLKANWGEEPPHHQTLQAAVDWSYDLLSSKEQVLLRRFSVFAGGFNLEEAEQIAGMPVGSEAAPKPDLSPVDVLDLLSRLIDKSLVVVEDREQAGEVRYRLLEVVRQYTREQLVRAGELGPARRRHAETFLSLVEEAVPRLRGAEQETWINRFDRELENLRAALAWSIDHVEGVETGLRLAAGLWQYWDLRGYFSEGRSWLKQLLSVSPERTTARARALNAAGGLAWGQGDFTAARALLSESLAIQKELGNQRDIAAGCLNLGILSISQGDYLSAHPLLEESLRIFRAMEHRQGISNVLNTLGTWASDQGEYADARRHFEESLALRRELGDKRGVAIVLGNLGVAAWRQGDCRAARPLLQECLERYQELGDRRGAATALNELGQVAIQLGEHAQAQQFLVESLAIWQELGNKEGIAFFLEGSARLFCSWCDFELAARLLGAAEILRERIGSPLAPADRREYERILAGLRSALNTDRLATAWTEGRTLAMEAAVALAASRPPQAGCEKV